MNTNHLYTVVKTSHPCYTEVKVLHNKNIYIMSINPTRSGAVDTLEIANHQGVPTEHLLFGDSPLDLPPPSSAEQLKLFSQLLRSDTAEANEHRIVSPEVTYNILLDQLNKAQLVQKKFNDPDQPLIEYVSDKDLLAAYYQGADAYAGMIALAPNLVKDNSIAEFQEWSVLAANLARRVEATKMARYSLAVTPAALAHSPKEQVSVQQSLSEVEQLERIYAYEKAAKSGDPKKIQEAFTGPDASRLERAQALFEYAHNGIPNNEPQLKIQCLTEVVRVLKDAVTDGKRPHDDDLVGIYDYFMLQSMLGRAIHDIIWLDTQSEETEGDVRARRISIEYLTNAADALNFVKYQAITAHEEPENSLHLDMLAFNGVVEDDQILTDARQTLDFLTGGLKELQAAEEHYLIARDDPWRTPEKDQALIVAKKKAEYLAAKAAMEQLETKIAEQQQIIRDRFQDLRDEHQHITDRLLALRSEHIGSITPGSKGCKLAKVVLNIEKQLNDARHFTTIYSGEYEPIKNKRFATLMIRANVLRLLNTLETISPESDDLKAPALPKQDEDEKVPIAA